MLPPIRFGKIVGQLGHVPVRYVDAELVRHFADPDFVVGGHGYIYSFIPKGEIWLDSTMDPQAIATSAYHEAVERTLMKQQKMSYDRAHNAALKVEAVMRTAMFRCGMSGKPLQVAGRWYARWLRTHRGKLAA